MSTQSVDDLIRDELQAIARLQARGLSRYEALRNLDLEVDRDLGDQLQAAAFAHARARCGGAWASSGELESGLSAADRASGITQACGLYLLVSGGSPSVLRERRGGSLLPTLNVRRQT